MPDRETTASLRPEMVVIYLDTEHYGRADRGDDVGDYKRPVVEQQTLYNEQDTSQPEEQEGGHGYAVGLACADGVDGLRQIAHDHADCGTVTDYVYEKFHKALFECFYYILTSAQATMLQGMGRLYFLTSVEGRNRAKSVKFAGKTDNRDKYMLTLIFTIVIIYFLWLVAKPLLAAYMRRKYEEKVNDFIRQSYGSAFGIDPDEMRRRQEQYSRQEENRPRRRGKIFTREEGVYIDFVEINEKTDYSARSASSARTPREPQVSDAEWEELA